MDWLRDKIQEKFAQLECQDYSDFLRVSKVSFENLRYLSNFHVILTQSDGFFCLRLITFHGKVLEMFNFDLENGELPEKVILVLKNLETRMKLCQGVQIELADQNCLIECLSDSVIARSSNCKFVIFQDLQCEECQKLVTKVKSEHTIKDEVQDFFQEELIVPKLDHIEINEFEHYEYFDLPVKKKRGRPVKEDKFLATPKKRGRPRLVLPQNETRPEPLKKVQPQESDLLKCVICLKPYKTEAAITNHLKSHEKYFDMKGSVDCPECKVSVEKSDLTCHFERIHSPKTSCSACLEIFKNSNELRLHIQTFHTDKFVCEICGKGFSLQKTLECHMSSIHSDIKCFFCDRCGKGFGHELSLQKHVQVACAMEEWKCEICKKIFSNRTRLRLHLMVHCEEKPYACRHCGYKSYKADNLSLHVKKTHQMRGVRADFITVPDILKIQTEFCEKYLNNARIK